MTTPSPESPARQRAQRREIGWLAQLCLAFMPVLMAAARGHGGGESRATREAVVELTLLQMNEVCEINPAARWSTCSSAPASTS